MKHIFTALFFLYTSVVAAQQNSARRGLEDSTAIELKNVVVSANVFFGSKQNLINRSGSGYFLSPTELAKQNYTDISRILAKVPGITSFDEDGFGLRPNISLRGVSAERSAKITVMEDGVLIAPAPYSAPAAYYFPTAGRMSAVEILKGSSQIEYGPFTTGGAINFVSTAIPTKKMMLRARANYGTFGNRNAGVSFGQNFGQVAYLIEGFTYGSNGFKTLPSGANTGFNKNDILGKVRFQNKETAKFGQALEIKGQYSDEISNETYLGITQNDFSQNAFQRYEASALDKIETSHKQLMATHTLDLPNSFRITTVAYVNGFERNWYKLDAMTVGGSKLAIANVLNDPSKYATAYAIMKGETSAAGALAMKNNNRAYLAKGIQAKLDKHWAKNNVEHDIEAGIRYHYDEEDRFQWVNTYQMLNKKMTLTKEGIAGTDANAITSAKALSAHTLYKISFNEKVTLSPGIRYENVALQANDYGKTDTERTGTTLKTKQNKVEKLIPGIGVNIQPKKDLVFFGGIHKGFSPPSTDEGSQPESSINYESGIRFSKKSLYLEFVGYLNDYSNLLGSDLAASGGAGTLSQFNAGEVNVKGIEFLLNYDLLNGKSAIKLPFEWSYTLTKSEFLTDFSSKEGIWGVVKKGDELPYIPKHQFFTSFGIETKKLKAQLVGRYNGAFRTMAGTGTIAENVKVPAYFVADFAANYAVFKNIKVNMNIVNLLNKSYLVARVPAGLRPGHPFGITGGLEFNL